MEKLRVQPEAGFTLLELLVVVAIIGILAAISIVQFSTYKSQGFDANVRSDLSNFVTAQEAYFIDMDTYGTGNGNDAKFTSRGFRQSPSVNITTIGTAFDFTVTGTAIKGCSSGTGIWTFDSSTGMTLGTNCS